jgi:hypothetical protein
VSANGHEGWVLEGALPLLAATPPDVIYLEFAPKLMRRAGYHQPERLLELLHGLGYRDVAHAGYVCDERWFNITSELRSQASFSGAAQDALQQPTWCRLRREQFGLLLEHAHDEVPENVLLVYKGARASQEQARRAPAAGAVQGGGPAWPGAGAGGGERASSPPGPASSEHASSLDWQGQGETSAPAAEQPSGVGDEGGSSIAAAAAAS